MNLFYFFFKNKCFCLYSLGLIRTLDLFLLQKELLPVSKDKRRDKCLDKWSPELKRDSHCGFMYNVEV